MARIDQALNVADLERIARRRLPRGLFDFIDRGAEEERTLRANADAIAQVFIRQRVGVDVAARDLSTTVFGTKVSMPVGIAVTGLGGLIHYRGEHALAAAAAGAGVPFTIGSSNFTAQADLLPICGDLLWRQMYPLADRSLIDHHIGLSSELGVKVLQVTLDSPVMGNREYMRRSGWGPGIMHAGTWADMLGAPHWLIGTLLRYLFSGGLPDIADMPKGQRRFWGGTHSYAVAAQDFTWQDLKDIRRRWPGVLVAKGISTAEDARLARDCGVDGIIVSNHGGRSLDGCVPSFGALREVVDAVAPQVEVVVDGGFRRGADIVKALAMGARMVMVGRASLFGLAAGGQAGASRALEILRAELDRALALTGCRTPHELTRDHLHLQERAITP